MLTGGRKAPLPARPGLVVVHACLLPLEASHNQVLRGPSPSFPEPPRLVLPLRSRAGSPPHPQPSLQLPLSLQGCNNFTPHTLRVGSVKWVSLWPHSSVAPGSSPHPNPVSCPASASPFDNGTHRARPCPAHRVSSRPRTIVELLAFVSGWHFATREGL